MQSDTILHKADRATEPTHVIDPDGEVIIILEDENRNFAVWDEDAVIDYTAAASVVAEGVSSGPSSTFEIPVISRKGNKKKDKKHRKRGLASRLTPEPEPQPEVEAEAEIEVELEPAADNAVASLNGDVQLDEETAEIAESVGQYFTGHVDSGEIVEHESFSIQVSAKHLTMASPHLKSTLRGGWKESITELNKGSVEIVCKDWDLEALLIVLKIIHCQHNELPRTIDLDLLAKVAVIADYYECTDKTRFFADRWIENLEQNFPLTYSRDLMLWLWISWLYRLPVQFEKSTSIAMTQSKSTITTLGLPIPNKILDEMNIGREDAIQDILASLQKQRNDFLDDTRGCSFECNSIMFGALTKQMRLSALLSPEPAAPFIGLRYQELVRKIRSFKTPYWSNSGSYGRHYCRASGAFLPEAIKDNVTGLNLERYSRVRYLHLPTFFTNKSIYEVY